MNKVCPLCAGTDFRLWRFGLIRCKQCSLVVDAVVWISGANEQLNEASFGDNYEPIRSFWVRVFETLNNRRTVRRLLRMVSVGGRRLLEIGVGSGSFLVYSQAHGFSPLGCDLSSTICLRVERDTGISMHCGPLESLPEQQRFDVIVMNHVLEHVSDPVTLLKAIQTRMNPGGVLHLAVPNVAAWEARLSGWNSYEPYHLLYFTPKTLQIAAEKAGLQVQRLSTHESFSGWFLAVLRTVLRSDNSTGSKHCLRASVKQRSSAVEHGYRLAMVTWGLITLPLRWIQQLLGKGDEVILLARKEGND